MNNLLTPVSRTPHRGTDAELLSIAQPAKTSPPANPQLRCESPEDAIETLRNQPDYDTLTAVLRFLRRGSKGKSSFKILQPGPQAAQIVHILVKDIIPNYWSILKDTSPAQEENTNLDRLTDCLLSITGVNAALATIRSLLQEARRGPKAPTQSHAVYNLGFILDFLSHLLQSDDKIQRMWTGVCGVEENAGKTRALQQEFVSTLASSKVVSIAAEAELFLHEADKSEAKYWLADSKEYTKWLGQNLLSWISSDPDENDDKLLSELLTRSLRLGHTDTLIEILYTGLLLQSQEYPAFTRVLDSLRQRDQRQILLVILRLLSSRLPLESESLTEGNAFISAATGLLTALVKSSRARKECLIAYLTDATGAGLGESCAIRRAALAAMGGDKEDLILVLEKSLNQFGDQLYIKHSPISQQEAHAQVLLLTAGYVHRISPIKLSMILRTSTYLNCVSNRIGASQERARFLGMVIGEALSGLVHGDEKKLDFHMDEKNSEDAVWYKSLVHVSDEVGPVDPLKVDQSSKKHPQVAKTPKPTAKQTSRPANPTAKSGFIIEEVDDEEDEDDGLVPYAKPDSDTEDSDDDPTLISRDKSKAPVYIRDLITYLRDVENYDRQKLALNTAPFLIRRKATHGTEVSSHAEELAGLLVGLSDKYELEEFHELRLQGMVAIIVSQPRKMGQWFAKTFFDGDYSLSQRASVLIILGLSGRELAGYETSEYASASSFPSKRLPGRLEKHWALPQPSSVYKPHSSDLKALPANAVDSISHSLSQTFLAPLAAEAADAATGPDVLKLSTFTSRLQDPSKTKVKSKAKAAGIRSIPNTTASLIATSFFFPLTSRFLAATHAASSGMRGILFQPYLLTLYLKTLALLLHAAGPSTLALPQMTSEFWDLLLGVRGQCVGELGITGAVLFGLMTLLDVNEADMRGLCERHGREVVESAEWVSGVFDRTRGGDDGEENQVKMMAAGVLLRLRDASEKYRGLLLGDMIGFA